jgi:endonuclease YncB( thermonuclease family)
LPVFSLDLSNRDDAKVLPMAREILALLLLGVASFDAPSGLPPADADSAPTYLVLHVPDGDSVVLKHGVRTLHVSLLGVAEPATEQKQGSALLRSRFLRSLLKGETVRLTSEAGRETGVGGRIRTQVYRASDGLWVNLEMIRQGYGVPSRDCPTRLREWFGHEESNARRGQLGVWSPPTLGAAQAEYDEEEAQRQALVEERKARRLEAEAEARREFLRTHKRCLRCRRWMEEGRRGECDSCEDKREKRERTNDPT